MSPMSVYMVCVPPHLLTAPGGASYFLRDADRPPFLGAVEVPDVLGALQASAPSPPQGVSPKGGSLPNQTLRTY